MTTQSLIRRLLVSSVLLLLLAPAAGFGQAEPLAEQAFQAFNAGNYEESAKLYEQVIKDYPTSNLRSDAEMRAGYANFLLGNYDKAIQLLGQVLGPPAPEEVQEIGHALLPQAMAAKASDMKPDAAGRAKAFEDAIKQFTTYIGKYPKQEEVETARYGRALCLYQIQKYDEAVGDLRQNAQEFARSTSIQDSQYLLALTLATQANVLMQKDGASNKPKAFPLYEEAEKLLRDIAAKNSDILLANDARFQLGEINFNRAVFSEGGERDKFYSGAIDAYRSVQAREPLIAAQQKILDALVAQKRQILGSGNKQNIRRMQRIQDREYAKLEQLRNSADSTVSSQIKVGQIFYQLGDYDAARVMFRHLQQFAGDDEQKRDTLYYITMTYALQGVIDKAVENYDVFQGAHKGAPIAQNLPLAMGSMFLNTGEAEKAVPYLEQQTTLYPKGEFSDMATIQKAVAEASLGRHDAAIKTFQDYLQKNPNGPKNVRVQAETGIANVYKDTQQWDKAIAAFDKVRKEYADQGDAPVTADFWVGYCQLQKGDAKASVAGLEKFVAAHGDHKLAPVALFTLGQARQGSGDQAGALATFAEVSEKFPTSEPSTFAYFQRASILSASQKNDEMVVVLREFIAKYPDDAKVFPACDTIGQTLIAAGDLDGAIASYAAHAEKYPESPQTPLALLNVSNLWRQKANAMGRYSALDDTQRKVWEEAVNKSLEPAEALLRKFPASESVALALQSLLESQRLLLVSRLKDAKQVEAYFQNLSDSFGEGTPGRSKVLFTLASFLYESDKVRALELMRTAYNASLQYAPADLDLYGSTLIEQKDLDAAGEVYRKIAADYPNPAGADPTQAASNIQEAQAISLYGLGKIAQDQGKIEDAAKTFDQLKKLYPWSPKILEADYGIAQGMFKAGKYNEAIALVGNIARARNSTADLRANAMLLGGYIQKKLYEQATAEKEKMEALETSIDYFIKIAQFFEGVPTAAAEGLWEGGQLLETQAGLLTDPAKKQRQLGIARKSYNNLVTKFPNSPFAPKAKERLTALGPATGG